MSTTTGLDDSRRVVSRLADRQPVGEVAATERLRGLTVVYDDTAKMHRIVALDGTDHGGRTGHHARPLWPTPWSVFGVPSASALRLVFDALAAGWRRINRA